MCYWGAHYVCFFKSDDDKSWIYYDDMVVLKVESWKDLILKSLKAHFHPTILFYRVIDEKLQTFVKNSDDVIPTFTEDEWKHFMSNCKSIDEMNQKKSDYLNESESRKSLSLTKTRPYDSQSFCLLKEASLKKAEKEIEDQGDIDNKIKEKKTSANLESNKQSNKSEIIIDLSKDKERKIENKSEMKSKVEIRPAEDEWICQNEKCENVNKIDSFICLSKFYIT